LETDWKAQQQQLGTDRVSYRTTNGCPATDGIDGHHSLSSLDLRHKQNNNKKSVETGCTLPVPTTWWLLAHIRIEKKGGERKKDREVILSSNEASTFI
jgi:bifunctional N-acetylglucosamine-1-phosphate-uridyltransferase/glucosamine-1-phosphate-acetyltransferase GlmU-like protein